MNTEIIKRITFNPAQCGGKTCIRGMRVRVSDIMELMANRLSHNQILEDIPDLEMEDIQACLWFAISRIDHPVIHAE